MERSNLKKAVYIIGGVLLFWFLFVQNGGDTITIMNRSGTDICEVYFAYSPEEGEWGRNRILSDIRRLHSRDVRLPLYFEWFAQDPAGGYTGKIVSCDGDLLDQLDGIGGESNFFVWEVR